MRTTLALVTMALVALAIPSSAAGQTDTLTIPFEWTTTECGNTIQVSGEVFVVFGPFIDTPSGSSVTNVHWQLPHVTGSDELGRLYNATGPLVRTTFVYPVGGGIIETSVTRWRFVGTSGAPTLDIKATFHYTMTSSGEFTAVVENVSAECH